VKSFCYLIFSHSGISEPKLLLDSLLQLTWLVTALELILLLPRFKVKLKVTLWQTVSQSISLGVEPHLGVMTKYLLLFSQLRSCSVWDAFSDERTGLSLGYAAGPCQRSLARIRVPWDSRPYFAVSDLRLPFSSPPTSRRVMVEVFDPASTRVTPSVFLGTSLYSRGTDHTKNTVPL
jgi:hypothetical protein